MTKEEIEKLALEMFPIKAGYEQINEFDDTLSVADVNKEIREVAIEFGLKLASMMYSEEQVRQAIIMSALSITDNLILRGDEILQSLKQQTQ